MKKLVFTAVALALALPAVAFAQGTLKIGTVDMNKAFQEYTRTKEAEKKINEARDAAKKEYDDRADAYKKALEDLNNLTKQLDAPALSADAKAQKAKERDEKITNIKTMEREINDFRQTRERQLQEQAMRMRKGIVDEISGIVMDKVKANNMDLVFDKSGMSLNGVPLLMYSRDNVDFTSDVIAVLNKPGRQSNVSLEGGASPASGSASGSSSATSGSSPTSGAARSANSPRASASAAPKASPVAQP